MYFLLSKSESLQTFIAFKSQVENQFNTKIKALQTDGEGEFRSSTNFLKRNGSLHQFTCLYTLNFQKLKLQTKWLPNKALVIQIVKIKLEVLTT